MTTFLLLFLLLACTLGSAHAQEEEAPRRPPSLAPT
jgi:hypothetical protein